MRHTHQTRRSPRFVRYLLLLVALGACQGQGRVYEAPASYPDEPVTRAEPAPAPAPPADPTPTDDRYATPPGGSSDWEGGNVDSSRSDATHSDSSRNDTTDSEATGSDAPGRDSGRDVTSGGVPGGVEERRGDVESGHAAPGQPSSEPPRAGPQRAESSAALGRDATASAPARGAPPSWDDARRRPLAPRSKERPGLATHWGETRYSPARPVDFERSHETRPAAVLELHYDDGAGARRLLPSGQWGRAEARALDGLRVSVVDAAGRTFPALTRGSRVAFVGAPGERYALSIENGTAARYEVVASVDGLDVLDGETASMDKRGYLIGAYSSVVIDGFRRSDAEVAAFRLGDVARSYAASKGKARHVGVIGIALFAERRPVVLQPPTWRAPALDDTELRRGAEPFPGRYARPPVW